MDILISLLLLVGFGLLLIFPYLATRAVLEWTVHRWPDPRLPEAARGVRRAACSCLLATIGSGLVFAGYCHYQSVTYVPGPWIDLGAELWELACFLPLGALLEVGVAVAVPVRVSIAGTAPDSGFRRF